MEKKKRSYITILILVILIICLSIGSIYIKFTFEQNEQLLIGISEYRIYQDKQIEYYFDNLYFVRNNNSYIDIIDSNNEKYGEIDSTGKIENVIKTKNGYLVNLNNGTYILSSNKTVIYKSYNIINSIIDVISKTNYYIEEYSDKKIVYDSNFKEVMTIVYNNGNIDVRGIVGGKVYLSDYRIIDINSLQEIDRYNSFILLGDSYYFINSNNSSLLVDRDNGSIRQVSSYSFGNGKYEFNVGSEVIAINSNGTLYDEVSRHKVNDDYYLDGKTCDHLWLVRDSKGELLYDKCSRDYDLRHMDEKIFIVLNSNNKYQLVVNGNVTKEYEEMSFQGDYVVAKDSTKCVIYDMKGEVTFNSYDDVIEFTYIGSDRYVIRTSEYVKIVDDKQDLVGTYNSVECKNNICITEIGNKYGLYYNGREQLENEYVEIVNYDNIYVVKDIAIDAVLKIENVKKSKEVPDLKDIKNNYYKDVDIDKIIENNRLESMSKDINKDLEFFKKYSYVIENNKKLGNYKSELYKFYKAIIDNKNFVNENNLLYALKQLKIVEKENVSIEGAAAVYLDVNKEIEIDSNERIPSVYFHELYHFLDYNINYQRQKADVIRTKIFTEAGAEVYSSNYFVSDGKTTAYKRGTYIYEILSYILGIDTMKDIYYSPDTDYEFYNLIVNQMGIAATEYTKMVEVFNRLCEINALEDYESLSIARDYLVYLYNLKNPNKDYRNDREFLYYLKYGAGVDKYSLPYKNMLHNINANIMISIYGMRRGYNVSEFKIENEGTYIYFNVLDSNYSIIDSIKVLYDFDTDRIVEYKRIEGV